jgi:hypothetical protein
MTVDAGLLMPAASVVVAARAFYDKVDHSA